MKNGQMIVNQNNEESKEESDLFYTLSKNGITTYINNKPIDFIKIEEWLEERELLKNIRGL